MPIESGRCIVRNVPIVRTTDFQGHVVRVVCPELIDASGTCRARLQEAEGGPLSNLLTRIADHDLPFKGVECLLRR